MFGRSNRSGNYAYTATKAKAMKSRLIKEDDYNKMLQLSVSELAHFASEAGYQKEVTELGDKSEGVELVELHAAGSQVLVVDVIDDHREDVAHAEVLGERDHRVRLLLPLVVQHQLA